MSVIKRSIISSCISKLVKSVVGGGGGGGGGGTGSALYRILFTGTSGDSITTVAAETDEISAGNWFTAASWPAATISATGDYLNALSSSTNAGLLDIGNTGELDNVTFRLGTYFKDDGTRRSTTFRFWADSSTTLGKSQGQVIVSIDYTNASWIKIELSEGNGFTSVNLATVQYLTNVDFSTFYLTVEGNSLKVYSQDDLVTPKISTTGSFSGSRAQPNAAVLFSFPYSADSGITDWAIYDTTDPALAKPLTPAIVPFEFSTTSALYTDFSLTEFTSYSGKVATMTGNTSGTLVNAIVGALNPYDAEDRFITMAGAAIEVQLGDVNITDTAVGNALECGFVGNVSGSVAFAQYYWDGSKYILDLFTGGGTAPIITIPVAPSDGDVVGLYEQGGTMYAYAIASGVIYTTSTPHTVDTTGLNLGHCRSKIGGDFTYTLHSEAGEYVYTGFPAGITDLNGVALPLPTPVNWNDDLAMYAGIPLGAPFTTISGKVATATNSTGGLSLFVGSSSEAAGAPDNPIPFIGTAIEAEFTEISMTTADKQNGNHMDIGFIPNLSGFAPALAQVLYSGGNWILKISFGGIQPDSASVIIADEMTTGDVIGIYELNGDVHAYAIVNGITYTVSATHNLTVVGSNIGFSQTNSLGDFSFTLHSEAGEYVYTGFPAGITDLNGVEL